MRSKKEISGRYIMSLSFWKNVLILSIGLLTGALLFLIWLVFISRWSRTFGLVAIFFLFVMYSNILAKLYLHIQLRILGRGNSL